MLVVDRPPVLVKSANTCLGLGYGVARPKTARYGRSIGAYGRFNRVGCAGPISDPDKLACDLKWPIGN